MFVIGLTGGLGAGKSTVATLFARQGAVVIDADKLAHKALQPKGGCFNVVIRRFGPAILSGGKIDRRKLADIVFKNKTQLKKLERILHPFVRKQIVHQLKNLKRKKGRVVAVLDVPLLMESGFHKLCDINIVVWAKQSQQVERASRKLGISRREAGRRIKCQLPLKSKLLLADYTINNSDDLKQTKERVNKLWQTLQQKTKS